MLLKTFQPEYVTDLMRSKNYKEIIFLLSWQNLAVDYGIFVLLDNILSIDEFRSFFPSDKLTIIDETPFGGY